MKSISPYQKGFKFASETLETPEYRIENGKFLVLKSGSWLEIEPRVGPSKVGVQKYHAWECTLAIFEVLSGCFWLREPPQVPRGKWVFLGSSGKF